MTPTNIIDEILSKHERYAATTKGCWVATEGNPEVFEKETHHAVFVAYRFSGWMLSSNMPIIADAKINAVRGIMAEEMGKRLSAVKVILPMLDASQATKNLVADIDELLTRYQAVKECE